LHASTEAGGPEVRTRPDRERHAASEQVYTGLAPRVSSSCWGWTRHQNRACGGRTASGPGLTSSTAGG